MENHNYPKKYPIAGISAELLNGNESTIYDPVWFIQKDNQYFYTSASGWDESDLKKLSKWDEEYVHWFSPDDRMGINPGESLYLAGHEIIGILQELVDEDALEFSFSNWKPLSNGYHGAVMTDHAYKACLVSLKDKLWKIVEEFLVYDEHPWRTAIEDVFLAYNRIYVKDDNKRQQAINCGTYYHKTRNTEQFAMESFLACLGKEPLFPNGLSFRDAVDKNLEQLAVLK